MIHKKPKVSVIVPVYNVEKYLKRCMNSLISQTLEDIEIIAVNDGSTDHSLEILHEYAKKDARVKVIDKENSGVSKCRNLAIESTNGEYIAFVDSDDWIDINMMEVMYKKASDKNSDLVMCTYIREFTNHSKEKIFDMPEIVIYEKEDISLKLHRKLFGPIDEELGNPEGLDSLGTVWSKLYKLEVIKNNNLKFEDLDVIGSNEDSLFNIHVFKYINRAVFLNKPFYHYWRDNPKSITSRYNPNLKMQWHNLFEHMYKFIDYNNLHESYYKALENRICMSVLGLGLNECSKANKASIFKRIRNIKEVLDDSVIKNAYKNFKTEKFPIHWKLFYFFNKNRMATPSYMMLRNIEFLRTHI